MRKLGIITATALAAALGTSGAPAADQFISIGTGGVTGVYYPTGGAICRLVNKMRKETGIRCSAESTGGSIYNINTIRAGELEFGVAQSDWQYHAYHGTSKFEDKGKFEDCARCSPCIRSPSRSSRVTIPASRSITDLKGKRVNIGNVGSGTRGTWEVIEEALGWQPATSGSCVGAQSPQNRPGRVRQQDRRLLLARRAPCQRLTQGNHNDL